MDIRKLFLVAAAALGGLMLGTTALAGPAFGPPNTLNSMEFGNFENAYRTDASCQEGGGCIPNGTVVNLGPGVSFTVNGAPDGYQTINPTIPNNIKQGDIFLGIFTIREISNSVTSTTYSADNTPPTIDNFTGYFAQQVASVNPPPDPFDPAQVQLDHISLTTLANPDPFGKLLAGEMFRIYVDSGTAFESNGSIADDIAKATDGILWAALGPGVGLCDEPECTTGYSYTHADLSFVLDQFEGRLFLGLNNVLLGAAYNAGHLLPINDIQENEAVGVGGGGGNATPPATGLCLPTTLNPFLCTQYILTGEVELNSDSQFVGGNSPWIFASNDPARLFIPEPGSLALLGAGLLAFGLRSLRRRAA